MSRTYFPSGQLSPCGLSRSSSIVTSATGWRVEGEYIMKISAVIAATAVVGAGGLLGCTGRSFGNGVGGSGGDAAMAEGGSQGAGSSTGDGGKTPGDGGIGGDSTAEAGASPGSTSGPCSDEPCLNDGTCSTDGVTFTCACARGFSGDTCDTNIDECSPNPCKNGSCTDGIGSFTCTCFDGFSGARCDEETDECSSNPCQNGGSCVDGPSRYACNCVTGYSGTNCELKISGCQDQPCLNGGTCSDEGTPTYTCACAPGFVGNNCQTDTDDCDPNPCNGGMCSDWVVGFTCSNCPAGYTGATCSIDVDECARQPCLHGGKCVNEPGTFSCDCSSTDYIGTFCQSYAECAPGTSPCQHAGKCFDIRGSLTCDCSGTGYSGTTCQTEVHECATTPCKNGGTCTEGALGTYACSCSTRFAGKDCEFHKFRGTGIPAGMDSFSADYVSGDGSVVAGTAIAAGNVHQSFRLAGNTFTPVAIPNGFSSCVTCGISQDGQILAGSCSDDPATVIRTFTQVGGSAPTFLPSAGAIKDAECVAMSSSGNAFLGTGQLLWRSLTGWRDITNNASGAHVKPLAINGNGTFVVGLSTGENQHPWHWNSAWGYEEGGRWVNSGYGMSSPPGSSNTRPLAINTAGSVVVGTATIGGVAHAIRWSGPGYSATDLGVGSAADVSADGSVVVGESGGVAAVWGSQGLIALDSLLEDTSDLTGWSLSAATAVSDDGKVIVGRGDHNGAGESFVVRLP